MENFSDTEKIIQRTEEISNSKIINREDFSRLIDISVKKNDLALLEEIAFQSKYLTGLINIIHRKEENINKEYFGNLENEFGRGITKIKSQLELLIGETEDFYKKIFIDKYFLLTQESLTNLNSLCSDLAKLKLFFNELQR